MTTLRDALQETSWRRLRAMGRRRGLHLSSDLLKAGLVDRLAQALPDAGDLSLVLDNLAEPERRALADLAAAGGRLPLRYLRPRHGGLGGGPLERLRSLGLIFHDRATGDVFIPTDVIALLPPLAQSAPPAVAPVRGADEPALIAAHDLACLLALLQVNDVRPLHGRWLPPHLLAAWGERCAVPLAVHGGALPPVAPNARSEMRTGRRRFLHYMAEAAGLIGPVGSNLVPAPAAWAWFDAAPLDRLNGLWRTFLAPDPALWRTYRLPGHDLTPHPDKLIAAVVQAMPHLDPSDPAAFAAVLLAQQPSLRDLLPANQLDADAGLTAAIADLLAGPLVWLGALVESDRERERERDSEEQVCPSLSLSPSLSVTAWGAHWLGMAPAPEIPPAPRFALASDIPNQRLTFTLAGGQPDPAHVMVMEEVGSREPGVGSKESGVRSQESEVRSEGSGIGSSGEMEQVSHKDSGSLLPHYPKGRLRSGRLSRREAALCRTSYSILPASFARALHHGWSAPALIDALDRLAERPLTGQEIAMLQGWAQAAERMTVRRLTVLETSDPGIISRLAATRRGRSLIVRSLSPRAVVVDEARLDQLARRLEQQEGVPPKVQGSGGDVAQGSKGQIAPASLPLRSSAHLWLALKVYQGLGRLIRLPARTPQALLDHLASQADPDTLAAAETAAEAALAALQDVVAGRAAFPVWHDDALPVEDSLSVIRAALAEGMALEMDYYTAGRDELTHRVVEPYRLEQRGGVHYLAGFCRRAQAERVFRIDRIHHIAIFKPDDEKN